MRKVILITILAFLITGWSLSAQDKTNEGSSLYQRQLATDPSFNTVTLHQEGSVNEAFVQQVSSFNALNVLQLGTANFSTIKQQGYNNYLSLTQEGNGNIYDAVLTGANSRVDVSQQGEFNTIYNNVLMISSDISIQQYGTAHEVSYSGELYLTTGIVIRQLGQGMKVVVKSN